MLPGETLLLQCNCCSHKVRRKTLASGNTFGGVEWTDGRRVFSMMPRYARFQYWYCPGCHTFQEVSKMATIDKAPPFEDEETGKLSREPWVSALDIKEPDWKEYLAGIEQWEKQLYSNPELETRLRMLCWRRYNDPYRKKLIRQNKELYDIHADGLRAEWWGDKRIEVPYTPEMKDNCNTVATWLYEGNPDKAMDKADLLRWLGRFELALQLLEMVQGLKEFDNARHLKRNNLLVKLSKNRDDSLGVVHNRI